MCVTNVLPQMLNNLDNFALKSNSSEKSVRVEEVLQSLAPRPLIDPQQNLASIKVKILLSEQKIALLASEGDFIDAGVIAVNLHRLTPSTQTVLNSKKEKDKIYRRVVSICGGGL